LPFDNLSSDPDQDYFVDGIVEDVITNLARNRWLTVIARNSTFAYKGKATGVRQIAREIGVRYIVEGSVRKFGNRVRITAQLIHAPDGDHVWAERYDRDLEDIFQLQDEIANQIAATIEPQLVVAESLRARGAEPEDLDAWDLYLRGTWHLYTFTEAGLKEAKGYFERAIERDADLAAAYGRLAYVHVQRYWYGPLANRDSEIDRAFEAARRAITLDERDALGHFALGRAYALRHEFENAASELRRTIDLNPNFAQAHFALGQNHYYCDRLEAALDQINTAITLSPHDQHIWTFYLVRAFAFCKLGDLEATERSAWAGVRQANATYWAFAGLASILGQAGKKDDAGAGIGELFTLKPEYSCAYAEADLGNLPGEKFTANFIRGLREVGVPESSAF
jgi:TolB-like protein